MQGYCLLFLTLVFVGTCTGRGHVQRARPRPSLPFASVSSTNGSSFEEILKELDVQYIFIVIMSSVAIYFLAVIR